MTYVVLGGTGTLGREITHQLLEAGNYVTILSRDELKQKEMAAEFASSSRLHFVLGDVRDAESLRSVFRGRFGPAETVFHCAALKHVDTAEANPEECIKTNLLASINVAKEAVSAGVGHVVFSSTDKAVDPINVYGMCKGISEKIFYQYNRLQHGTKFSVFRWGNVVGSRGSIVEPFVASLLERGEVCITDARMTRFWITIEDAVRFMLSSYRSAPKLTACLPPIKAAPVVSLARAIADEMGVASYQQRIIGMRPGEKLHEVLVSQHQDHTVSSLTADQYTESELRALVRPLVQAHLKHLEASA
jgi:UDP-N-acetylglucosamine 4,6-dehydratase